jgi:hypothetical protein
MTEQEKKMVQDAIDAMNKVRETAYFVFTGKKIKIRKKTK